MYLQGCSSCGQWRLLTPSCRAVLCCRALISKPPHRQKDIKDGRFGQITSSALETKLRDDLERLKKIRWGLGFFQGSGFF